MAKSLRRSFRREIRNHKVAKNFAGRKIVLIDRDTRDYEVKSPTMASPRPEIPT